ncbi:MAG: LicD family protein [Clostridia bacterium]|nr:LicD family protein [Clostridia bacterium]
MEFSEYNLEKVQSIILEIFVEFDRICRKHNIPYSIEGGTMLGAYKYKGYVPWDDDIDVVMLRDAYDRFMEIAPSELNEKFFLQNYHTVPEFPLTWAKICTNRAELWEHNYENLPIHHGLFIDIFPIDYVCEKDFVAHVRRSGFLKACRFRKLGLLREKGIRGILRALYCMPRSLQRLTEEFEKEVRKHNADADCTLAYEICNPNQKFRPLPISYYTELSELEFCGVRAMVSAHYKEFLEARFGDLSKEPPIEKRKPSHGMKVKFFD